MFILDTEKFHGKYDMEDDDFEEVLEFREFMQRLKYFYDQESENEAIAEENTFQTRVYKVLMNQKQENEYLDVEECLEGILRIRDRLKPDVSTKLIKGFIIIFNMVSM